MNKIKILFVLLGMCLVCSSCKNEIGVVGITSKTSEKDAIEIIKGCLGTESYKKEQNEYGWTHYLFEDGINNDIKYSEITLSIKNGEIINYSYSMDKKHEGAFIESMNGNGFEFKVVDYPVKCYTSQIDNSAILVTINPDNNKMGFIQVFNRDK